MTKVDELTRKKTLKEVGKWLNNPSNATYQPITNGAVLVVPIKLL